jgi:3-hydroxyacyl-CoA dehydrogenase/enoyl-CoA hydratase/3-hydroxybutyryl-CoA epimerase
VKANPKSQQPFDVKGYKTWQSKTCAVLAIAPAMLRDKTKGCYPALKRSWRLQLKVQVDVDTALRIESRYFTQLTVGQVSKNMIGTFYGLNAIKSGASRPC